jgi:hypothetical protein
MVKVKLSLGLTKHYAMKTYWGVEIWRHAFMTSALDASEYSASRFGRFTTRERAPLTNLIGGCVGPRAGPHTLGKRKIPSPRRESNPPNPDRPARSQSLHHLSYPEELHNLYDSQNIIRVIKSRRMKLAGHLEHMNIRMDLGEIWWDVLDWMHLAQNSDQWRAFVNTVMNLRTLQKAGNFLSDTIFSRRTLLHGVS